MARYHVVAEARLEYDDAEMARPAAEETILDLVRNGELALEARIEELDAPEEGR